MDSNIAKIAFKVVVENFKEVGKHSGKIIGAAFTMGIGAVGVALVSTANKEIQDIGRMAGANVLKKF